MNSNRLYRNDKNILFQNLFINYNIHHKQQNTITGIRHFLFILYLKVLGFYDIQYKIKLYSCALLKQCVQSADQSRCAHVIPTFDTKFLV
jgi:hypothetical protein